LKNKVQNIIGISFLLLFVFSCSNKSSPPPPAPTPKSITVKNIWLNTTPFDNTIYGTNLQPIIKVEFTEPVKPSSITSSVKINNIGGGEIPITTTLQNHDSVLLVQPSASLNYLSKYNFVINSGLRSSTDGSFSQM
jgi:hypothetical protein